MPATITTKERIISAATQYFNKEGYGSLSLFEIANRLGMSRGNLTYHFKSKDDLLKAISRQMWTKIEAERQKSRQLPSFENLHNEAQLLYKIQREYSFIFLDNHVLGHPEIQAQFSEMIGQTIKDNETAIAFAIKLGNMNPEPLHGLYQNIAFITWMLSFFWMSQQIIRGKKTGENAEKMIWSILIPHFTPKGVESFKSFFGKDYYESLGKPFRADLSSFIPF